MAWLALGGYRGPASIRAFLGYLIALYRRELVTESYRRYVTDSLQLSARGYYLQDRWSDLVHPKRGKYSDMTGQEIADMVIETMGLEVL